MDDLAESVDRVACDSVFSGAVFVDDPGRGWFASAYGRADRAAGTPNTVETRFGIASGTKSLTALTVMSLVADGTLALATPVRDLLAGDLRLVDARVTVEHLLSHRSGIGDYLDEDDDGYDVHALVLPAPHLLSTTDDYLTVLDGHPQKFAPGTAFSYCNSGYVVLALVAERATGVAFHDLVAARVCEPAGLHATAFLCSDALPGDAARGYLAADPVDLRTNVFHLPRRGNGDGGVYTTVHDVATLWRAIVAGGIVPRALVAEMVRPRSDVAAARKRYGLGFWLHPATDVVILEGMDAGVSFRSAYDPRRAVSYGVVANTTDGAWPVARALAEALGM